MSQNSLLLIVAVVGFVVTSVLEHFGLVPSGTATFIYGALSGALGVSGAVSVTKGAAVTLKPASSSVASQGSSSVNQALPDHG